MRWASLRFLRSIAMLLSELIRYKVDSGRKKFNVLRIRGPSTTRIGSRADIIALQVWGFDPTLDGKDLNHRTMIHITKGVDIRVADGSILDLLIIVERV